MDPALFQENERTAPKADARQYLDTGAYRTSTGDEIPEVTVAYETWGNPNDPAILVCHALSGDSHAVGWWDRIVGPGKAIDTDRFFVIGSNVLGGCQGTTGPASMAPDGRPYGSRFPIIQVGDMVEIQSRLLDYLGVTELWAVAGGSMGGMQALEWTVRFPDRVRKCFVTASCAAHSAMQIGFNEVGRQAIMRDPKWMGGDYDPGDPPADGLSVSRMLGHMTFLSDAAFMQKFDRRLQGKDRFEFSFGTEFQVESYLNYQGDKFTRRFDANSFLYLTRAIDYFEVDSLAGAQCEFGIVSFTSDWLYPSWQSERLEAMAREAGLRAERWEIDLPYGHDAFLLDGDQQGAILKDFLER